MSEKLYLQWNDFKENAICAFGSLKEDKEFSDVTLACEDGNNLKVHKVIIASSSLFFRNLLRGTQHTHPLVYMRGVKSDDLVAIIDFLYSGEASVSQENLDSFLALAEELQLKGLMGKTDSDDVKDKVAVPETPIIDCKNNAKILHSKSDAKFQSHLNEQGTNKQVVASNSSEYLQALVEERCLSMMNETSERNSHGHLIYICTVCGKEGINGATLRHHIEANHLEEVSLPCSFCGKAFRSRSALRAHRSRIH